MAQAVKDKLNSVQEKMHRHWSSFRKNPRRIAKILFKAGFKYIVIIVLVKLFIIAINIAVFLLLRILFGSGRIPANSALHRVLTVSRIINNAKRLYYVLKRLWGRGGFESLVQFVQDPSAGMEQFSSYLSNFINTAYDDLRRLRSKRFSPATMYRFFRAHSDMFKRLFKGLMEMMFGFMAKRLAVLCIIPMLGISTASIAGMDCSELAVGGVSLAVSQAGTFIGRSTCSLLCKVVDIDKVESAACAVVPFYGQSAQLAYRSIEYSIDRGIDIEAVMLAGLYAVG